MKSPPGLSVIARHVIRALIDPLAGVPRAVEGRRWLLPLLALCAAVTCSGIALATRLDPGPTVVAPARPDTAPRPSANLDGLPNPRKQIRLRHRAVHQRSRQLEVLRRPHLQLQLQRHVEPEPVRIHLRGVGPQRVARLPRPLWLPRPVPCPLR